MSPNKTLIFEQGQKQKNWMTISLSIQMQEFMEHLYWIGSVWARFGGHPCVCIYSSVARCCVRILLKY